MSSKEIMTINDASSYLGMPLKTINKLAEKGSLPAKKVDGKWQFLQSKLKSWKTS